jgi:hypothetical protein
MVRERHNGLPVEFVADLRPAEDDHQLRPQPLEERHDLRGRSRIPNVNAQPHDPRPGVEDRLDDVERALVDVELAQHGARLQFAEIGEQVAQAEGAVDVARVESGKDDVRHGPHLTAKARAVSSGRGPVSGPRG